MFDIESLIRTAGYFGLFGIIFAESGLLVGFFLPGDSLLFTAGILANSGFLNIYWLCLVVFFGAVLGDNVGYAFGKKVGPKIFKREDSLLFHKDNLLKAKSFFDKHGGKTIIIARFVPVVRTFAPIIAGVGNMHYSTFVLYNFVGAFLWAVGLSVLGFAAGEYIPNIDKYLLPIILIIIFISVLPGVVNILRTKESRDKLWVFLKSLLGKK